MNSPKRTESIITIGSELFFQRSSISDSMGLNIRLASVETFIEGLERLKTDSFELVVVDDTVETDGIANILAHLRNQSPYWAILLIAQDTGLVNALEAAGESRFDILSKPYSIGMLVFRIRKSIERAKLSEQLFRLKEHSAMSLGFDNLVGSSKPIQQIKEIINRVAATDISLLISGEPGTGRQHCARIIHEHSHQRFGRFVSLDCALIPQALFEVELQQLTMLGEKGNLHGTLFLGNADTLSTHLQLQVLKFLKVTSLQTSCFGGGEIQNLRLISSASTILAEMTRNGQFSTELYNILNVVSLALPPLKNRAEDIEQLIVHLLRHIAYESNQPERAITARAVDKLLNYFWPGNIEELKKTILNSSLFCAENRIKSDDIRLPIAQDNEKRSLVLSNIPDFSNEGGLLGSNQRNLIVRALSDNNWNYKKTAAALGIGRTTLWRKIKKFDLNPSGSQ
ncbi:MAG: sigma 54-interacting transcriptional regulator [candidate division Zixibacteria bacterium]|nr:sigma 54-interacting transcriptional regulator [candidate division Zixibacteria bacterium]